MGLCDARDFGHRPAQDWILELLERRRHGDKHGLQSGIRFEEFADLRLWGDRQRVASHLA